ncbi:MAG: ornithine cyclodeaminase [Candidatus Gracilibacteria bacterium]
MKIITSQDIAKLDLNTLLSDASKFLEEDLKRWQVFHKSPRHAIHYKHGVFELMPCADEEFYTYKYVNGHPDNPKQNKMSIVATGMLADIETGYPQLFCDMTILTAVRTAATSALAAKHLARKNASVLGIIGTGAQSEFQAYAMKQIFDLKTIRYYDRDPDAMEKFANNMASSNLELIACKNGTEVVQGVDILTTCICEKAQVELFPYSAIKDNHGLFINAIGGDCPGKTELDPMVMKNARIVVEFFEQTKYEGEIQNLEEGSFEFDELWEIIQGQKMGRRETDDLIVFDAVGFALADYSVMRMLYKKNLGTEYEIFTSPKNPKDLFSLIACTQGK